jgi:hypothetical protein
MSLSYRVTRTNETAFNWTTFLRKVEAEGACPSGYWGEDCQHQCPPTCDPRFAITCAKCKFGVSLVDLAADGICNHCINGKWGGWCQKSCSQRCLPIIAPVCDE